MTTAWRLFAGINTEKDIRAATPEAFRFHGPMKALFYKCLRLINPAPDEWLDQLTGNGAILRDIYREYLTHEKQTWRRENLTRALPFLILLTAEDTNYTEVGEWFIAKIIENRDQFTFSPISLYPHCWYSDAGHREVPTPEEMKEYLEKYDTR